MDRKDANYYMNARFGAHGVIAYPPMMTNVMRATIAEMAIHGVTQCCYRWHDNALELRCLQSVGSDLLKFVQALEAIFDARHDVTIEVDCNVYGVTTVTMVDKPYFGQFTVLTPRDGMQWATDAAMESVCTKNTDVRGNVSYRNVVSRNVAPSPWSVVVLGVDEQYSKFPMSELRPWN